MPDNIYVLSSIFFSQLILMLWSANKFVDGAAFIAKVAGIPTLLIGMLVVGFGTSAPEMLVSATSAMQGNPGLALGNAYGSNIANIALVLGLTGLISPIAVHSSVLKKELPILIGITLIATFQLWDRTLSRTDAVILLIIFIMLTGWSIFQGYKDRNVYKFSIQKDEAQQPTDVSLKKAFFWLLTGLCFLLISSRILVLSAIKIAGYFGISDLIIGLTVVAIGTSLPELITSVLAISKNEHDLALGNIVGSNLFNTLIVVGIAGMIHPMAIPREIIYRDCLVMGGLTLSLLFIGYGFRINRIESGALLSVYIGYTSWLAFSALGGL